MMIIKVLLCILWVINLVRFGIFFYRYINDKDSKETFSFYICINVLYDFCILSTFMIFYLIRGV